MPEWQIDAPEYWKRLDLAPDDFVRELRLPDVKRVQKILPLRDIAVIESMVPMTAELLLYLIRRIKTLDGRPVFERARIEMVKIDPRQLKIGQRFAYRDNYQQLLEEVPGIFGRFFVGSAGLGDLGAYFIFGRDAQGEYAAACYIPPIVEKHGADLVVMDGIHRNFIQKQAGSTVTSLLVTGVSLQFPCAARDWSDIKVIGLAEKPKDINERYFELHQGLFRDLKFLGIDG